MRKTKRTIFFSATKNTFWAVVVIFILIGVYLLNNGNFDSDLYVAIPRATHPNGQNFIGSESCMKCHSDIYVSHIETAHYKSSSLADTISVKGSFGVGKNTYQFNDSILFIMNSAQADMFQEAVNTGNHKEIFKSKIDLVVGSGTKGQTYLSWEKDKLYQLPISYFTPSDSWTVSPGINFNPSEALRPVNAKCLECHTTFAKNTALYGMGNAYEKTEIIYGIDCERCHGPSAEHVEFHNNNPEIQQPQFVINNDSLSRQQRLDACALCHSGVRSDIKPAFEFMTGDKLIDFSLPPKSTPIEDIDVHGNQYGLLKASKCFTETRTMECATCHDPHKNQRDDTAYFNNKCMQCHSEKNTSCGDEGQVMMSNKSDCISCHMPVMPSKSMAIQVKNNDSIETAVNVRTHLIKIYSEKALNTE